MSIYIRAEDRSLWERAEVHARRRRLSVSGLVLTALEEYLAQHDPAPEKGTPAPDAP